ncbi:MAG: HAD family phosphatase [Pseudomonadota bacterium]
MTGRADVRERYDAVVFDVGNVLVNWRPERLYERLIPDADRRAWFLAEVVTMDWHKEQDRGRSCAEAIEVLTERFPEERSLIAAFYDNWLETIPGAIDGSVAILETLKGQGWPCHAITNFSAELWPETVAAYPFLGIFDIEVVSGVVRLIKPDPAIFRLLCERADLDPDRAIFIDDVEANCIAAAEVGFDAIRFTGAEDLRADLVRRGFAL